MVEADAALCKFIFYLKFGTFGSETYDRICDRLGLQLVEPVLKNLRVSRAQFIKGHGHAHIGL